MWTAKVIKLPVCWHGLRKHKLNEILEISDCHFNYNKSAGYLEGLKHYRIKKEYETCKTCGHKILKKKKIVIITTEHEET